MLKNILTENIDFLEVIFIALSAVSAFLSFYYFFYKKSVGAFIKLMSFLKSQKTITKTINKHLFILL